MQKNLDMLKLMLHNKKESSFFPFHPCPFFFFIKVGILPVSVAPARPVPVSWASIWWQEAKKIFVPFLLSFPFHFFLPCFFPFWESRLSYTLPTLSPSVHLDSISLLKLNKNYWKWDLLPSDTPSNKSWNMGIK